jgi:cell division protein FtsQ
MNVRKKSLSEKIIDLLKKVAGRGEKSSSLLAQKFSKQSGYKGTSLGTGTRKMSFLEKLRRKREEKKQQKRTQVTGWNTGNSKLRSIKTIFVVGFIVSGFFMLLTGPMQKLYGNTKYFRIQEIEISGCVMTNPTSLRKFADISYGMNMLTIDPEAIQDRLEEHPWVSTASIRRIWPDGLTISINEFRPQALIAQAGKDGIEYLDRKGNIFATVTPGQEMDFPVITGLDTFDTDTEKKELLETAISFLKLAGRNNPNLPAQNVSEIHFSSEGELVLYLVEHPFPIYLGKGEIKRKYYQLRKVLEELYRKKKGDAIIDKVAYIRMDYQKNKVLVAQRHAG